MQVLALHKGAGRAGKNDEVQENVATREFLIKNRLSTKIPNTYIAVGSDADGSNDPVHTGLASEVTSETGITDNGRLSQGWDIQQRCPALQRAGELGAKTSGPHQHNENMVLGAYGISCPECRSSNFFTVLKLHSTI